MDQQTQLKIQMAEKKAERLRAEEEVLRIRWENGETHVQTPPPPPSGDTLSDSESADDEAPAMEKFSSVKSLVAHTDFGSGPIRHQSRDGKFYHGRNNKSTAKDRGKQGRNLHCFYIAPHYETKPPTRQWDHHCAPTFCTHHENPMDLNRLRTKVTVFRCLGH